MKRWLLLLLALTLILCMSASRSNAFVKVQVKPGGQILVVTGVDPNEYLQGIGITYCDGTKHEFYRFRNLTTEPLTFLSEKPIQKAVATTITIIEGKKYEQHKTSVKHSCDKIEEPPSFTCRNLEIPAKIIRGEPNPVSFNAHGNLVSASFKFPGVTGVFPLENYYWKRNQVGPRLSIDYKPGEGTWVGTFSALHAPSGEYFVPTGTYSGVELILKDSFGQQAKCKVKYSITIE